MKHLIIANWKANPPSLADAKRLFTDVKKGLGRKQKVEVVVCPPFIFLPALFRIKGSKIKLGTQNVFPKEGAFTGEISVKMIKGFGCQYAIVGHSERRASGESNEMINEKIKACLSQKIIPIFCIGESKQERQAGITSQILRTQLKEGLKDISSRQIGKLVIAYEPIWAIGTGNCCVPEEAMSMRLLIRKILTGIYNKEAAKKIKLIYGGSVDSSIVAGYINESMMDGVLVGGASLRAKEFIAILRKF